MAGPELYLPDDDYWRLKVVTPPSVEILTAEDLRAQCRIDIPDEDVLSLRFIAGARKMLESRTRRCFLATTLAASATWFPRGVQPIELPRATATAVTSITYRDGLGTLQTLDPSDYVVDLGGEPGLVIPAINTYWPTTDARAGAVTVTFTAGAAAAADVDPLARQAVALLAGHWFIHRELEGMIPPEKQVAWDNLVNLLRW